MLATEAMADVFARFQDTVDDPPPVTDPLVAESHATVGPADAAPVFDSHSDAYAEAAGIVRSRSLTHGIAGGNNVTDQSAMTRATAVQSSDYIVLGLPAGTAVNLDAAVLFRGYLETQYFGGGSLHASVRVRFELTDSDGTETVEAMAVNDHGVLSVTDPFLPSDFVYDPLPGPRIRRYEVDLEHTISSVFTVEAGEVFTIEATLETVGYVEAPTELFSNADFYTDNRGLSFSLIAQSGEVVPYSVADLEVTIDDLQDPVPADQPIPYTITVTNHGPDRATDVVLEQIVPGGFFAYSSAGGDGTNRGLLIVPLGELAPGASVTIETGFYPRPGRIGPIQSSVNVSSPQVDPAPGDRSAFEETMITAPPPLAHSFTLIDRVPFGTDFPPSINNTGTVSYLSVVADDEREVRIGDGGTSTLIADTSDLFETFGFYQTINDAGVVAFLGSNRHDPAGDGIFTGNGGQVTSISDATGEWTRYGTSPSINENGDVAFMAEDDIGRKAVLIAEAGGAPVVIADNGSQFDAFTWPFINDQGQVTFRATHDDGSSGIYFWEDGTITTVADSSGPFDQFGPRATLNESGAIAFTATLDNGGSGVFVAEQGTIRTYVDTTGPYRNFGFDTAALFSGPSINNAGQVAFLAGLDTGTFGIFTGPDPQADKVIGRGDPLFGSFVVNLAFDWQGQNNAGQVAFAARLLDGRTVIARSDWADNDLDGVLDVIEQGAPGGGDGNGDGFPDRLQDNVASLPAAVGDSYLTLVSPPGTQLVNVEATSAPFPRPIGATFPFGVVGFEVQGIATGQAAQVDLIVPGDQTSHIYFKQNLVANWYSFAFDGTTGARAAIDTVHGEQVTRFTLAFVDGNSRGDSDGAANGRIVDPGGPAIIETMALPTVQRVVINDGEQQRSMVSSITVTFDRLVTVEPGAFQIREIGSHRAVKIDVELSNVDGKTVARLSFRGGGVVGGSLSDGSYRLTIHGAKVRDTGGQLLDGDNNGAAGGNHVDEFFRLFGDSDGDGDVDCADTQIFACAIGKRSTSDDYLWYLDYHDNGRIWLEDLAMFLLRYGRHVRNS